MENLISARPHVKLNRDSHIIIPLWPGLVPLPIFCPPLAAIVINSLPSLCPRLVCVLSPSPHSSSPSLLFLSSFFSALVLKYSSIHFLHPPSFLYLLISLSTLVHVHFFCELLKPCIFLFYHYC